MYARYSITSRKALGPCQKSEKEVREKQSYLSDIMGHINDNPTFVSPRTTSCAKSLRTRVVDNAC